MTQLFFIGCFVFTFSWKIIRNTFILRVSSDSHFLPNVLPPPVHTLDTLAQLRIESKSQRSEPGDDAEEIEDEIIGETEI